MKIILPLLLFFGVIDSFALQTNSLSGKVYDAETKQPLPGATVYIPNLKSGALAKADGSYEIRDLPEGKFIVQVKFVGYTALSENITVNDATRRDFGLKESHMETGEVVVTGSSEATELRKSPVATAVVDRSDIEQSGATNVIDAISRVPGISQVTTGQGISKPVIRGLGYNRVVVMNDGIKQEGQQWGDEHGIEIDQFSVDRVEILKGPASLMYGSDGLAGVINILSPNPVSEGKILGSVLAEYQTNSSMPSWSGAIAGNRSGFNWRGRFSQRFGGNYRNAYDNYVYNSAFNETNANGYIGLNRNWGFSHLNFSVFNQNLGLVESERDPSTGQFIRPVDDSSEEIVPQNILSGRAIDVPRQNVQHYKLSLTNSFYFGNSHLDLDLGYQKNIRKEFTRIDAPDAPDLHLGLNTLSYRASYIFPEYENWDIALGANGMSQNNTNYGLEVLIPDYSLFDIGGFAVVKRSFGGLSLSGGLRFDSRSVKAGEGGPVFDLFSVAFSNLSGSAGMTYELNENFLLKLNVARGFRAPNPAELGSNGVHEGTFRYEIGNSNLKSETSLQFDAGLSFGNDHISAEISLFSNRVGNYIFLEKLQAANGGDSLTEELSTFSFRQGDAQLAGAELSVDIHPHPLDWLHFENSFSIVRGELAGQPDSMKYLPMMPAPRFRSELRTDFREVFSWMRNFFARLEFEYNFPQNQVMRAFGTETETTDYNLVNFGLGANITNGTSTLFSLSLIANNLFDRTYQSHLSRLKYAPVNEQSGRQGVFNMGRNIVLRLNVPLELM